MNIFYSDKNIRLSLCHRPGRSINYCYVIRLYKRIKNNVACGRN